MVANSSASHRTVELVRDNSPRAIILRLVEPFQFVCSGGPVVVYPGVCVIQCQRTRVASEGLVVFFHLFRDRVGVFFLVQGRNFYHVRGTVRYNSSRFCVSYMKVTIDSMVIVSTTTPVHDHQDVSLSMKAQGSLRGHEAVSPEMYYCRENILTADDPR